MNRKELTDKLNEYGFPRSEYMILSGGSLLLRGLREETADIDMSVSRELAEKLDLEHCPKDELGCFVPFEDVQMKADMESRNFDVVDGFRCQTLEDILKLKRRLMRPKDIRDIEKIEAWLNSENNNL